MLVGVLSSVKEATCVFMFRREKHNMHFSKPHIRITFRGVIFHVCTTHSLHQDKLAAADERTVDLSSLLSEYTDTLLQPPLLHLCWHVIL